MIQLQLQKCELSFTDTKLSPCVCKEAGAETHFSKATILMTSDYLEFSAVTFSSWCGKGERNSQNFLLCHLSLHMEVHGAIVSTPKAGKAVQGDHWSLKSQGVVQGKRTDVQNWLGKSSTVLVILHSLARSSRMTVPHSWYLWWLRCQVLFRGHAIRVKWR